MTENIEPSSECINYFDNLIKKYLNKYTHITKQDINSILAVRADLHLIKIIDGKLYFSGNWNPNNLIWETRREALKHILLSVLNQYKVPDCEFVIVYNLDSINISNKIPENLPIIISTSCLESMNYILCPDFTFAFSPEYNYKNYENMCDEIVQTASSTSFSSKQSKIIWRGSANNKYRSPYLRVNETYDIRNIGAITPKLGNQSNTFSIAHALSRKDKVQYKYHLHLNGHLGDDKNGAYSSALKWGLAANSLVFYCAPVIYKEFWMDSANFQAGKHYIYCSNETELGVKLKYYKNNQVEAEIIAANGYNFFKSYLWKFNGIVYYMYKLLSEYSKLMNYKPTLESKDTLITEIAYSNYLNS